MMDHPGRIERVRSSFEAAGIDALLVTNLTNTRYLTGFFGTNGQVLITQTEAFLLTDPRYAAKASSLSHGAEVLIYRDRLTDVLPDRLSAAGVQQVGIEASTMTVAQREDLAGRLDVSLIGTKNVVERHRRRKDAHELALIRDAVALADATFDWIRERIVPGVTERQLAFDLEFHMREAGAEEVSFPPIVGAGPLSAYIHHSPSERTLEKGDLVLLDFGCRLEGYCSDLTRTVVLGPATDEQQNHYALVLEAQAAGMAAIKAGVEARAADAAARAVIDSAGHAERFGHGLGHGVGLDIHEAPSMNRISEDVLEDGEVVTVEPGVYVDDVGGIRIEDCVVVTQDGVEVLGTAPKDGLMQL